MRVRVAIDFPSYDDAREWLKASKKNKVAPPDVTLRKVDSLDRLDANGEDIELFTAERGV